MGAGGGEARVGGLDPDQETKKIVGPLIIYQENASLDIGKHPKPGIIIR